MLGAYISATRVLGPILSASIHPTQSNAVQICDDYTMDNTIATEHDNLQESDMNRFRTMPNIECQNHQISSLNTILTYDMSNKATIAMKIGFRVHIPWHAKQTPTTELATCMINWARRTTTIGLVSKLRVRCHVSVPHEAQSYQDVVSTNCAQGGPDPATFDAEHYDPK